MSPTKILSTCTLQISFLEQWVLCPVSPILEIISRKGNWSYSFTLVLYKYRPSILWVKLKGCKWLLISYWILLVYRTKWKAICKENCAVYLMSLRVFFRAPLQLYLHIPRNRAFALYIFCVNIPNQCQSRRDGWDLAEIIGISPRSRQYLAKCKILGKIFAEISPRSQPRFTTWQDLTEISASGKSWDK